MTFNNLSLHPSLQRGIKHAGYVHPTPIQEKTIPLALEGHDILGLAQTGTGKTAAFMLPILQGLVTAKEKGQHRKKSPAALILAPTRELAEQIYQSGKQLGAQTGLRLMTMYGGVGKNPQITALQKGMDVVVACPGRLLDILGDGKIDLSRIEYLVLDEADRMCDMGFLPDIKRILKHLPKRRQTFFFSATMPKEIRGLTHSMLHHAKTVDIGISAPTETVSHALFPVPAEQKKPLLFAMLEGTATGRVLIFTRTKHKAKNIAKLLQKREYRAAALQGDMTQNRRQDSINGFRNGKYDILVATDIAARGIDVSEISHVINFDMPGTVDAYTHRIGRTGRARRTGDAFTIAAQEDGQMVKKIEKVLKTKIDRKRVPGFNYGQFVPEKQFAASSRK